MKLTICIAVALLVLGSLVEGYTGSSDDWITGIMNTIKTRFNAVEAEHNSTKEKLGKITKIVTSGKDFRTYRHVGCFEDDDKRVLRDLQDGDSGLHFANHNMTLEWCYETCQKREFHFFGVQHYWQCFCGKKIQPGYQTHEDEECNLPCKGNQQQMCGGSRRISVFTIWN